MKKRVLFLCTHNSARSQMAEEYLRKLAGREFETESAGYAPTTINPFVVQVMEEEGIYLSGKRTKSVYDLLKASRFFGYVITVCDRENEPICPVFPGLAFKMHWDLKDPEQFDGTEQEKLEQMRMLRDHMKALVIEFISQNSDIKKPA